ncbi:MAG: carbamoyltransferase N-terminal domain-containing protein, partial [Bacteroidota bacterium]
MATVILGFSAFFHDSAAALLIDGEIVAAAQEERFTRIKGDASFPKHAIAYVFQEANIEPKDLDAVAFYEKPLLKFERLLETYHAFVPFGLGSFLKAMPIWLKDKLFIRRKTKAYFKEMGFLNVPIFFPEHHLSHAASAFYPSPFQKATILTLDGVGEWSTLTIGVGEGNHIRILREQHFPHSLGLLYSAFTYFLGFTVNNGEYKVMGLAAYGNPKSEETQTFFRKILENL